MSKKKDRYRYTYAEPPLVISPHFFPMLPIQELTCSAEGALMFPMFMPMLRPGMEDMGARGDLGRAFLPEVGLRCEAEAVVEDEEDFEVPASGAFVEDEDEDEG